jgi:hypothetical protein
MNSWGQTTLPVLMMLLTTMRAGQLVLLCVSLFLCMGVLNCTRSTTSTTNTKTKTSTSTDKLNDEDKPVWGDQQCLDYGYNHATLLCSTCRSVAAIFAEHSELHAHCLHCCASSSSSSSTDNSALLNEEIFQKAVLFVDKHSLPFLPDIDHVVKHKKQLSLQVKYRFGAPQLRMFKNKNDDVSAAAAETVSIQNWDKTTIIEYLSTHLKQLVEAASQK